MSLPLSAPLSRLKGSNFPGYTLIDVLKIDIEGAEFDTLTTFLAAHKSASPFSSTTLPIGQLQLELHAWDDYGKFDFFHGWWTSLEAAGLRPFWTEANMVFVNYNPDKPPELVEVSTHSTCFASIKLTDPTAVLVYQYPRESFACVRTSRRSSTVLDIAHLSTTTSQLAWIYILERVTRLIGSQNRRFPFRGLWALLRRCAWLLGSVLGTSFTHSFHLFSLLSLPTPSSEHDFHLFRLGPTVVSLVLLILVASPAARPYSANLKWLPVLLPRCLWTRMLSPCLARQDILYLCKNR